MKKIFLCLSLMIVCSSAFSQKAMTFQEAIDKKISIEKLDSLYAPALSQGADSLRAVFRLTSTEFHTEYIELLKSLAKHLKANNFTWTKKTKCFNRIYFNERGKIDYFLYNFRPGEIAADKEEQFKKLLNEFIKTYSFPLPASSKFSQCSPVTYSD